MALEGHVDLKLGHHARDGIEVIDVHGEIRSAVPGQALPEIACQG